MKRCFKCGAEKPRTEFYRHPMMGDGLLGKCKPCTMKDARATRVTKNDYYIEYDRQRNLDPQRKARASESFKRCRNPERKKAADMVSNAVRDGKLKKHPCWVCGNEKSEGHHPDYSQPLEVVWLCTRHHRATHAIMLRADLKR